MLVLGEFFSPCSRYGLCIVFRGPLSTVAGTGRRPLRNKLEQYPWRDGEAGIGLDELNELLFLFASYELRSIVVMRECL